MYWLNPKHLMGFFVCVWRKREMRYIEPVILRKVPLFWKSSCILRSIYMKRSYGFIILQSQQWKDLFIFKLSVIMLAHIFLFLEYSHVRTYSILVVLGEKIFWGEIPFCISSAIKEKAFVCYYFSFWCQTTQVKWKKGNFKTGILLNNQEFLGMQLRTPIYKFHQDVLW